MSLLILSQREVEESKGDEAYEGLNEDIIVAQGIIFFAAGYETTSSTLSTLCFNLASNPEVQQRLVEEIRSVMDGHDGKITLDNIGEMVYLEAAVNENLRMWPPAISHSRTCRKDCEVIAKGQLAGGLTELYPRFPQIARGLVIKRGMRVDMPIYASHYHEDFFENPEQFQPERFLKGNAEAIFPYTYRPFGGDLHTQLVKYMHYN